MSCRGPLSCLDLSDFEILGILGFRSCLDPSDFKILGFLDFGSCLLALASNPESDLTESAEITDLAEEREVKLPRWAESRNAW